MLSSALTEWAERQEFDAEDQRPLDAAGHRRWAASARALAEMVEEALERTIGKEGDA